MGRLEGCLGRGRLGLEPEFVLEERRRRIAVLAGADN